MKFHSPCYLAGALLAQFTRKFPASSVWITYVLEGRTLWLRGHVDERVRAGERKHRVDNIP